MSKPAAREAHATRRRRHRRSASTAASRVLAALLAVGSGLAAIGLAWHHPLAPALVAMVAMAVTAGSFQWPRIWPLLLPALLPVIGFAPWSGWISFEEMDVLALSVAAGSYLRIALQPASPRTDSSAAVGILYTPASLALSLIVLAAFAVLTLVATLRGVADAGEWLFGWYQGYHEPMNGVRIAKAFLLALLLLPPWLHATRTQSASFGSTLTIGASAGLALASLATIWERMAFTGLLNFSSDYRTTALFWEMHVGGAALDGFLALTFPFAVSLWLRSRTPLAWGACTAVLLLASYSALTTFSRGVYLAVPVGLAVLALLEHLRRRAVGHPRTAATAAPRATGLASIAPGLSGSVLVLAYLAGSFWMFSTSGYRGILALLGATALALPLPRIMRSLTMGHRLAAIIVGMLLGAAAGLGVAVPKGAYAAWMLLAAVTAASQWRWLHAVRPSATLGVLALGGQLATTAATAWVAFGWGGIQALDNAAPVTVLLALGVLATGFSRRAPWPDSVRWQGSVAAAMALGCALTGVFFGGGYMSGRFATGNQDLEGRFEHWRTGRDMLITPAHWWLGKGLGRYPSSYFLTGDPSQHPGDYRLMQEDNNGYLKLTAGLHVQGFGEVFRVTQRVDQPGPSSVVSARVRAEKDTAVQIEVCAKHLLYDNHDCVISGQNVKGQPGIWQALRIQYPPKSISRGHWYAPRILAFSMAVTSRGGSLDIDDVALTTSTGTNLLGNGDFSNGMAHWFFSSDRNHLPWHAKNLLLHLLVEQGALSVGVFAVLIAAALWQISLGSSRREPLAPVLAASICGFLVVGLFDSLLDVPRVALLFYWLVAVAMCLRFKPLVVATRAPSP